MTLSWQAAVDFTFMDRPSWKGKEKTQFGIACRHFGEFYGEDEPCENITRKDHQSLRLMDGGRR